MTRKTVRFCLKHYIASYYSMELLQVKDFAQLQRQQSGEDCGDGCYRPHRTHTRTQHHRHHHHPPADTLRDNSAHANVISEPIWIAKRKVGNVTYTALARAKACYLWERQGVFVTDCENASKIRKWRANWAAHQVLPMRFGISFSKAGEHSVRKRATLYWNQLRGSVRFQYAKHAKLFMCFWTFFFLNGGWLKLSSENRDLLSPVMKRFSINDAGNA